MDFILIAAVILGAWSLLRSMGDERASKLRTLEMRIKEEMHVMEKPNS